MNNYVKESWDIVKEKIKKIEDVYTKEETIDYLQNDFYYKNYFGKAKNRTMMVDNPKLYKSIYHHTAVLEDSFKKQKTYKGSYNFKYRMIFLVEKSANIENMKCECGKSFTWNRYCRYCPEPKKTWSGKQHTKRTKIKQRKSTLDYLEKTVGQITPRYNIDSIELLEQKAKELNIKDLQHAENGGEYHIKELGYFVDGYSKEKNIVIEVDEKHHFDTNGFLKEKDLQRQQEIESYLGCRFIRIKYD